MCGIAGWFTNKIKNNHATLERMIATIKNRGPDYQDGIIFDQGQKSNFGTIGLGHARLSIIDLTESARQPMCDSTGKYWIVFNGEIYNFKELKQQYLSNVYLRSKSDTEVLLSLYILLGSACLSLLNGMFAFAIVDMKENKLFCARDRFGKKPFFYYHENGEFVFGSQVNTITSYLQKGLPLNQNAVLEFFNRGYIGNNHSIFKGIKKLSGGFCLSVDSESNITEHCYWHFDREKIINMQKIQSINESILINSLQDTLDKSIAYRLISDVPVGIFLSGGIDSSLIAATAAKMCDHKIDTFCIGFSESEFDESPYARMIASHIGSNHHQLIVNEEDFYTLSSEMVDIYDEPFADQSAIPTIALSRFCRKQITVALSGDAGDEAFLGYTSYRHYRTLSQLYIMPQLFRLFIRKLIKPFIQSLDLNIKFDSLTYQSMDECRSNLGTIKEIFNNLTLNPFQTYLSKKKLANENRWMIEDICNYMCDDILVKVDRASMSIGLEVRNPLLDINFIEKVFYEIPLNLKRSYISKYIQKKMAERFIPRELLNRPKKGFSIPVLKWVNGSMKKEIEKILHNPGLLEKYFAIEKVRILYTNKRLLRSYYGTLFLWRLYILSQWINKNKTVIKEEF